jgi:hypothetical protein
MGIYEHGVSGHVGGNFCGHTRPFADLGGGDFSYFIRSGNNMADLILSYLIAYFYRCGDR